MAAKRKSGFPKEKSQALRKRYTWYLRPPFKSKFDSEQWWKGQSQIEPAAALYELVRRHPDVGKSRRKVPDAEFYGQYIARPTLVPSEYESRRFLSAKAGLNGLPEALACLCCIGMNSWPKLTRRAQQYWRCKAGSIKGVDCRDDSSKCVCIYEEAMEALILNRAKALKPKEKTACESILWRLVDQEFANDLPTVEEVEFAILREALTAHRNGHLLISIAPGLRMDTAAKLMGQKYREHQKLTGNGVETKGKKRARPETWLSAISEFDTDEASRDKAKTQIFVRYRRISDSIQFDERPRVLDYISALIRRAAPDRRSWDIGKLALIWV